MSLYFIVGLVADSFFLRVGFILARLIGPEYISCHYIKTVLILNYQKKRWGGVAGAFNFLPNESVICFLGYLSNSGVLMTTREELTNWSILLSNACVGSSTATCARLIR